MSGICALLLISIMTMNNNTSDIRDNHPALRIMQEYYQLTADNNTVVPYMVNLMAIDLLRKGDRQKIIRDYLVWYLNHLNYPDKDGLNGSIYDYEIRADSSEIPLFKYDSIDSYAATFLILIEEYYVATGDSSLVDSNLLKLDDLANLIVILLDDDGLTTALPRYNGKYLMDNCESYGGLDAYITLAGSRNWIPDEKYYLTRSILERAIHTEFFDQTTGWYYWSIAGQVKAQSSWDRFYPDAFAQLFPILYNTTDDDQEIKKDIWRRFHANFEHQISSLPVEQKIIYEWTARVVNR